jgi:hypothetical protein
LPRVIIAERREKTAPTSDLRVQEFVATVRGALIDLAWKAPDFDAATRQLVGFELFRDDTSTEPPSRLTSALMPSHILEARGLEVLPHSEYGVQPIWRIAEAGPHAVIEFGPPRLTKDLAGPGIFVPPEERIHSLAFLQRQGAITSEELEFAVERFLGRAQPAPEGQPVRHAAISGVAAASAKSSKTRRLAFTYIAIAVVMVLALIAGERLVGGLLLTQPSATHVAASTPSAQPPSSESSASPTPAAVLVDLRSVLIKPTDLRPGYVVGQTGSKPLCPGCVPQVSSLAVQLQNKKLKRTILSAASIAPSPSDTKSVAAALMAYRRDSGGWGAVAGLGDEGFDNTIVYSNLGQTYYFVVWRTGVMTNEIILIVPVGTLNLQNAVDLARIQQARAAHALR